MPYRKNPDGTYTRETYQRNANGTYRRVPEGRSNDGGCLILLGMFTFGLIWIVIAAIVKGIAHHPAAVFTWVAWIAGSIALLAGTFGFVKWLERMSDMRRVKRVHANEQDDPPPVS